MGQFSASDQRLDTQDAFVLELNPSDGTVQKNEFFGLEDDAQNGVLRQGGLLDMHLTQDGHAVVMGNVKLFPVSDTSPINAKKPYLIERYDTISTDPDLTEKWKEEVTCEKIDLPTSDDDVPHDDIFEDDIFEDDIILKPTPKPTFEKIDDIISFPDDKL